MADKGGALNRQGRNMQRRQGKFTKPDQQNQEDVKEKWPVDEIDEDR
jgi:hypothetical protein